VIPGLWTRRRIVPIDATREEVDATITDGERTPGRVSPAFVRAILRGRATLPAPRRDAVAFRSLRDTVVSLRAIGDRLPPDRVRPYDGGRELYSSAGAGATPRPSSTRSRSPERRSMGAGEAEPTVRSPARGFSAAGATRRHGPRRL
jgi:hypothetical protein